MTKYEALLILIGEANSAKVTKKGLKFVREAGDALSLTENEQIGIEAQLDYRNRNSGELYNGFETVAKRRLDR